MKDLGFLIFGREPSVSFAETYNVLGKKDEDIFLCGKEGAIISDKKLANKAPILLGSIPKSGIILQEAESLRPDYLAGIFEKNITQGSKFHFGLSFYSIGGKNLDKRDRKSLGLSIKKILKQKKYSVRLVESMSENLSSVDIVKNKLITKGADFCLFFAKNNIYIGKTESVQPYEDYSNRDYGRPVRDAKRGMTPPKLALSMINLSGAKKGDLILDPFCGIGTIVQEALLLGCRAMGSDIDSLAIQGARENMEWLKSHNLIKNPDYVLESIDARDIGRVVDDSSVDAIVSEFDLGPPLSGHETIEKILSIERSLSKFYLEAIKSMGKVLKKGSRAVVVSPYFSERRILISVFDKIQLNGFKLVKPYPKQYESFFPLSGRGTLIYGRPGQVVFREILILEKF